MNNGREHAYALEVVLDARNEAPVSQHSPEPYDVRMAQGEGSVKGVSAGPVRRSKEAILSAHSFPLSCFLPLKIYHIAL